MQDPLFFRIFSEIIQVDSGGTFHSIFPNASHLPISAARVNLVTYDKNN